MSLNKLLKPVFRRGYEEKEATTPSGVTLRYACSPDNGKPPLMLLHGQTGAWQDYCTVLVGLSDNFRVYAVDCHGHGGSSRAPERYTAQKMCEDFAWFIGNVIKDKAFVSGHSSGGLLTAFLSAQYPQLVRGIVLEDPPFFSTEQGERWEKSFAYVDTYAPMHAFLNQTEEKDWVLYYLRHALWGNFVGEKGMAKMISCGEKYRLRHPGKPLHYWFLPDALNHMFWFMDSYDLRFGEAFYTGAWFEDFDQAKILRKISCKTVLIHTNWSYDENGILMAAMSGEDAERVQSLIADCRTVDIASGHDSHFEKPEEYLRCFDGFAQQ